jgi:hypothetical protein
MERKHIYRFMNFFEFYNLILNGELKFTKLRLMQDRNEGIGEVIRMQSSEIGFMLRNSRERIADFHLQLLEKTYVSCWTGVPNSMAMWLLYSPDFSAIRVRTTEEKLRTILNQQASFGCSHALDSPPLSLVARLPVVSDVKYVDFEELHRLSKEALITYYGKISKRLQDRAQDVSLPDDPTLEQLKAGIFLKDIAFEHEKECRAAFTGYIRNSISADEFKELPNTMGKALGHPLLDDITPQNSPATHIVKIQADFIEEVCFDPRLPQYRRDEILRIVGKFDCPVVDSNVFGYMLSSKDLTVPEDDYIVAPKTPA